MHVDMDRIAQLAEENSDSFFGPESVEQHRDRIHHLRIEELLPQVSDPAAREILALLAISVRAREI